MPVFHVDADFIEHGGVQTATVTGWKECTKALSEIATKYPATFKQALGAEVKNLKRSIAATLRNYQITKTVPVPNPLEIQSWKSLKFAPRNPITKLIHGKKNQSALSKEASVKIISEGDGFRIGHFGTLQDYAIRFQNGVPSHIDNPSTRHWLYRVLSHHRKDIHDHAALTSIILPISPAREYIGPLAEKCRRDFFPGLAKCLEKIISGEMKKAGATRS